MCTYNTYLYQTLNSRDLTVDDEQKLLQSCFEIACHNYVLIFMKSQSRYNIII